MGLIETAVKHTMRLALPDLDDSAFEDYDIADILSFISKNLKGQIDSDIKTLTERLTSEK